MKIARNIACGFTIIVFAHSASWAATTPEAAPANITAKRAAFDAWEKSLEAGLQDKAAEAIIKSPELLRTLVRGELLRVCGPDKVWEIAIRKDGAELLRAFLADTDWMESFLAAGPADFAQSLENLRLLYRHCQGWDDPVVKRMGTALALQAGAWNRYRLVERFQHLQKARRDGLLHAAFDRMPVREMRSAIYLPGTAKDYQFLLDDLQQRTGDYLGACWAIRYTDPNVYGFSVQGWGFVDPWCHHYGNGTGNRPLELQRQVGGVCGTLSCYGASAAQAHGVMALTVGQPGHCAYVVRLGKNWPIGNDVFGAWSTGFGVYEGTSYMTSDRLFELVEADHVRHERALRLSWVAHVQRAAGSSSWQATYEQALAAQPLCYPLWLEYIKTLEAVPATPAATWLGLGRRAAATFTEHQEAAWALTLRCFQHAAPQQKPAERAEFLLACHKLLNQRAAPKMYGYPLLSNFLNTQTDLIADPTVSLEFFGQLLSLHYSVDPSTNWIFGIVMNWGTDRFAKNPATASAFARKLGEFFAARSSAIDRNFVRDTISAGIRTASEAGDAAAFRQWNEAAVKLLPAPVPADVQLNPEQAAQRPKIDPIAETMLSPEGMLQTSSVIGVCDRPITYCHVLDGSPLGYFDTNNEANPWAQVRLAGEAEITHIVLVDRYEYPSEYAWDVPLKISTSADGTTWTEVARFDRPQKVYHVDLHAKKPHARFVRIERFNADPAKPNTGRFHFRSFLVYGRKLY